MVKLTVELPAKDKLNRTNFLNWKEATSLELDKKDTFQQSNTMAILTLNCDVKIVSQFADKANDDPCKFWKLLKSFYQVKTIQNQSTFLNQIFTTVLSSDKLEAKLTSLYIKSQILCSLIDNKKTKPSTLLDSVIATWAIINLPNDFKMAGELIIKKCEIEKATPSLKQTIEELRLVVNGYSHCVWIHFLTSKTKTNKIIKTLFNQIEAASGEHIAHLVSENRTEFKNKNLTGFYNKKGIKHLPTAPYTPKNNPFAEQGS
ncbi:hypothetical protein PCANC_07354 [Puccinia coronata f. sp. avenae]|uniref:Integrase catalytic domain-containing protein n=1 Tax=Puccinia coronata f. sp. avenae TaxID=200324 RepID=A0A2N5T6J2_9BASI|nr:hypothetical protein PCANC_07354 [Puccinia coronata f. sp. avenae]